MVRGGGDAAAALVLRTLCRLALEPDSCVRRTEETFVRYGARSLVVAKLIPAYQTVASALAGMSSISFARFLVYDAAGAALWSAVFMGLGYVLHDQIERAADIASQFGFVVGMLVGGAARRLAGVEGLQPAALHPLAAHRAGSSPRSSRAGSTGARTSRSSTCGARSRSRRRPTASPAPG